MNGFAAVPSQARILHSNDSDKISFIPSLQEHLKLQTDEEKLYTRLSGLDRGGLLLRSALIGLDANMLSH